MVPSLCLGTPGQPALMAQDWQLRPRPGLQGGWLRSREQGPVVSWSQRRLRGKHPGSKAFTRVSPQEHGDPE